MARSNSPPHPSMSLPKSIDAVKKIFDADRRNPVDREVAAKHLGYSGKSGASDKALAALAHFGLTEKVGKGEVRVSQLAMDIMHPDPTDARSKDRALLEAGMKPQLYKELQAQFPDQVSEGTLESYLLRIGFVDAALSPAKSAYLETLRFLEQSKVFESGGSEGLLEPESGLQDKDAGDEMQDEAVLDRPTVKPPVPAAKPMETNETEWMRNPLGRGKAVRVLVTGSMGGKEIGKLIKLLEAQKAILDDDDEDFEDLR
ncbi:hypothetical protein [Sphingomonas sp.]|uniref:hypothetical protein n=1 Tax=Sphingomonas sp. TaxID=28214 RepID=UPI001ED5FB85|nr:hypothetical protein [Sphingomonas sp.]MBX3595889.1 hypothetical protein [Sphingomonas sp.]